MKEHALTPCIMRLSRCDKKRNAERPASPYCSKTKSNLNPYHSEVCLSNKVMQLDMKGHGTTTLVLIEAPTALQQFGGSWRLAEAPGVEVYVFSRCWTGDLFGGLLEVLAVVSGISPCVGPFSHAVGSPCFGSFGPLVNQPD